jgi:uncharacterized delta-60 repeat protein
MATTYKKLSSYFLERSTSANSSMTGYYYGNENNDELLPYDFNSAEIDPTFNIGLNTSIVDFVYSIVMLPDDKMIISGQIDNIEGPPENNIIKINVDGTVDESFSQYTNYQIFTSLLQPDGKILIGGVFTAVEGVDRNRIARLKSNGALDISFNPNANNSVQSIALQPDGKIIIGGSFTTIGGVTRNSIARLNSDGTLDASFNPNANGSVDSIVLQPDGKILVSGYFTTIGGVTRNRIARLNSDGTLDASFNPNANGPVNSIVLQPDGKIIIGGSFTTVGVVSRSLVALLNSDGSVYTSFNANVTVDGPQSFVSSIKIQKDEKILIGGSFSLVNNVERRKIARLNSDGSLDNNFNLNNTVVSNFESGVIRAIEIQSDNKIVLAGGFYDPYATEGPEVIRIKEIVDNAPYRLLYTVPANTKTVVKNIFSTNHNDFPVFYDIAVLPENQTNTQISEKHYYVWDNLISDKNYEIVDGGITLSAGDKIYAYSSTDENISFNVFGIEITE